MSSETIAYLETGAAPRILASGGKLVQGRNQDFRLKNHLPQKFIFSSDFGHFILEIGKKWNKIKYNKTFEFYS